MYLCIWKLRCSCSFNLWGVKRTFSLTVGDCLLTFTPLCTVVIRSFQNHPSTVMIYYPNFGYQMRNKKGNLKNDMMDSFCYLKKDPRKAFWNAWTANVAQIDKLNGTAPLAVSESVFWLQGYLFAHAVVTNVFNIFFYLISPFEWKLIFVKFYCTEVDSTWLNGRLLWTV